MYFIIIIFALLALIAPEC